MPIELNDYFLLGICAGLSTLICFVAYVWLSLAPAPLVGYQSSESKDLDFELSRLDSLQTICRAGAIVMLVGFWFDGGLFKLPTAATFWILLELGAVQPQNLLTAENAKNTEKKAPFEISMPLA